MPDFFQTGMGRKFYEVDVPRLVKALERIATSLEAAPAAKLSADFEAAREQALLDKRPHVAAAAIKVIQALDEYIRTAQD